MINGSGGLVVFGIADDKTVKGQQIGDKTTQDIGIALNKFDPAIDIQPVYKPFIKDKYLIAFYSALLFFKPNTQQCHIVPHKVGSNLASESKHRHNPNLCKDHRRQKDDAVNRVDEIFK